MVIENTSRLKDLKELAGYAHVLLPVLMLLMVFSTADVFQKRRRPEGVLEYVGTTLTIFGWIVILWQLIAVL